MTEIEHEERTLTVRLDDDLLQRFKAVALAKRRPMSEIIREFISWYVEKETHGRV
jgi:predicted transcriptional regulator